MGLNSCLFWIEIETVQKQIRIQGTLFMFHFFVVLQTVPHANLVVTFFTSTKLFCINQRLGFKHRNPATWLCKCSSCNWKFSCTYSVHVHSFQLKMQLYKLNPWLYKTLTHLDINQLYKLYLKKLGHLFHPQNSIARMCLGLIGSYGPGALPHLFASE